MQQHPATRQAAEPKERRRKFSARADLRHDVVEHRGGKLAPQRMPDWVARRIPRVPGRPLPDRVRRAYHRRRPDRVALLGREGRGLEVRRRAGRNRNGLQPKLPARSVPLGLATPEILDAVTDAMSFAVKEGVSSMRFETHDSASMLFRAVETVDLGIGFCSP
jgi:hypothetical protein